MVNMQESSYLFNIFNHDMVYNYLLATCYAQWYINSYILLRNQCVKQESEDS